MKQFRIVYGFWQITLPMVPSVYFLLRDVAPPLEHILTMNTTYSYASTSLKMKMLKPNFFVTDIGNIGIKSCVRAEISEKLKAKFNRSI